MEYKYFANPKVLEGCNDYLNSLETLKSKLEFIKFITEQSKYIRHDIITKKFFAFDILYNYEQQLLSSRQHWYKDLKNFFDQHKHAAFIDKYILDYIEKKEEGETMEECVRRETLEETGLTIENPRLCGTKQFETKNGERYVVLFYKTDRYCGNLKSSDEGEGFWIPRDTLREHALCDDFESMIKVFDSDELSEFYYYKEDGSWKLKLL